MALAKIKYGSQRNDGGNEFIIAEDTLESGHIKHSPVVKDLSPKRTIAMFCFIRCLMIKHQYGFTGRACIEQAVSIEGSVAT
jgi:hypothetical protein